MDSPKITTLGELKRTDYKSESIQQELAGNLRKRLSKGLGTFSVNGRSRLPFPPAIMTTSKGKYDLSFLKFIILTI